MFDKEKAMINDDDLINVSGGRYVPGDPLNGRKCPVCEVNVEEADEEYKSMYDIRYHCTICGKFIDSKMKIVEDPVVVMGRRAT